MGSWREAVGTLLHVGALKSDILTGCPGWSVLGLLCPQSVLTEGISIPETLPFNTTGHPRDLSKLDPLTFPHTHTPPTVPPTIPVISLR